MPALTPTALLTNYYLHYTPREGAQNIISAGAIKPGRSGRVYLTRDFDPFGSDAADKLSIVNKPVELACLIQEDLLADLEGPSPVESIRDGNGDLLRGGGGSEYYVTSTISVSRDKEHWVNLRSCGN